MRIVNHVLRLALVGVATAVLVSACASDSTPNRSAAADVPVSSSPAVAPTIAASPETEESAETDDFGGTVPEPAVGYDAELGSLSMFATSREMLGWMPADGRSLKISGSALPLFAVIGCEFGCTDGTKFFKIPHATGPLSSLGQTSENPGPLKWKLGFVRDNFPTDEGPLAAYPNQVFFTAAHDWRQQLDSLADLGFTRLDLGEQIGPGITAWQVPSTWPSPIDPIVGEARLFLTGTTLPNGWIPADGRVLPKNSQLGGLLNSSGFVRDGEVRAPKLQDVGKFSWAIAQVGVYPQFD